MRARRENFNKVFQQVSATRARQLSSARPHAVIDTSYLELR